MIHKAGSVELDMAVSSWQNRPDTMISVCFLILGITSIYLFMVHQSGLSFVKPMDHGIECVKSEDTNLLDHVCWCGLQRGREENYTGKGGGGTLLACFKGIGPIEYIGHCFNDEPDSLLE